MRRWLVERFFAWIQWQRWNPRPLGVLYPEFPGLCSTRLPRYPLQRQSASSAAVIVGNLNCVPTGLTGNCSALCREELDDLPGAFTVPIGEAQGLIAEIGYLMRQALREAPGVVSVRV